ncbi:MAG: T9SS type A sorting domain-containing protein, partial [Candidatus Delongbacteria bacterium]|nr:T9SS type A sorting domain-containing protein [Candidatus Delongbacteria bacterium]MCG2761468.1 T9SS type A sorting domain-containing protein [Candidatus Delongbacteria bacterium]
SYTPLNGEMVGSIYRQLNDDYGTGTVGGMIGEWTAFYNPLSSYTQTIYSQSLYQSEGTLPGGRYPYVCEFINGECFAIFNDYDTASAGSVSQPMFAVSDAFWYNWDDSIWSEPKRVESKDSLTVIPNAWQGTGDVVYDPVSEYYYWTQGWKEGLSVNLSPVSCVVGRTKIPWDPESWEWTDYKDLRFDLDCYIDSKEADYDMVSGIQFAYSKDISGNGTGKGIGVAVTKQGWTSYNNLSYTYTTNWGGDSLLGSWKPNWVKGLMGLQHVPLTSLFDWIGETLTFTGSIGYNLSTNTVFSDSAVITIDIPYIMWDISVVTTEENIVHVLCMVFPASSEYPNCIFPWTDSGFRAGYYDIRGEITDTGVNWQNAVFIANPVDNDKSWLVEDGGMEFISDINRTLSLSYFGYGFLFAGWLDKPWSGAVPFSEIDTQNSYNYIDDGFIIHSKDNGSTWLPGYTAEVATGNPEDPIWDLKYAGNATETPSLFEEGWSLANHGGTVVAESYGAYAACQYYDPAGIDSTYLDKEQYLHIWYVGYAYGGFEQEEMVLTSDFKLFQNYPNPFNPVTEIKFVLSSPSDVNLSVFNTNGQLVKTLIDGKKEKGLHTVNFNAKEFNSGIYFYRLKMNGKTEIKKMILLK